MTKYIYKICIAIAILVSKESLAQYREPRGRYYSNEDYSLPSIDFTSKAIIVGIILFVLGFIISNINKKQNQQEGSVFGGCLIALSLFCAIPALAWLQVVISSIWLIGFVLVIIAAILMFLWGKIKK